MFGAVRLCFGKISSLSSPVADEGWRCLVSRLLILYEPAGTSPNCDQGVIAHRSVDAAPDHRPQ